MRRFWLWLGVIATAGLVLRVAYVFAEHRHDNYFGDAWAYHRGGVLLADGHGFVDAFRYDLTGGLERASAAHPPLYTIYLAAWSLLGIDGPLQHRVVSCLLGAATVVVVGLVARRLAGDRAALVAAGLAAVYPALWLNDAFLLSESAAAFTVALSLLAIERFRDQPGVARALQLGGAFGLAALTRAELLLLFPLVAMPLVLFAGDPYAEDRFKRLGATAAVGFVLLAPWVGYNLTRFDKPVTISNGLGATMLGGSCDGAYYGEKLGYWSETCPTVDEELDGRDLRAYVETEPDESVRDVKSRELAFDYIEEHKGRAAVVAAARVGRLWNVYRPAQNVRFDADIEGRGRTESWAALLSYYVLVGAAIAGLVKLRRGGRPIWPYLVLAGIVTFSAAITFGVQRYRLPVDVALPVLAACLFGAVRPPEGTLEPKQGVEP